MTAMMYAGDEYIKAMIKARGGVEELAVKGYPIARGAGRGRKPE